jgi:hypothetical protein
MQITSKHNFSRTPAPKDQTHRVTYPHGTDSEALGRLNAQRAQLEALNGSLKIQYADRSGFSEETMMASRALRGYDKDDRLGMRQSALDREVDDLAKGDPKARAVLRLMASFSPILEAEYPAQTFFNQVRSAEISGKDVVTFFRLCDCSPVKSVGVLHARHHGAIGSDTLHKAIDTYGKPDAAPFPVNQLFQGIFRKEAVPRKSSGEFVAHLANKIVEGKEEVRPLLGKLMELSPVVDPENGRPGYSPLYSLDSAGIRGEGVTKLFRACKEDPLSMLAVLRSIDLEEIPGRRKDTFHQLQTLATLEPGKEADEIVEDLFGHVKEYIPKFAHSLTPEQLAPKGLTALTGSKAVSDLPPVPSVPKVIPAPSSFGEGQRKAGK